MSLVETVVTLCIFALLFVIALPLLYRGTQRALQTGCTVNLRSIGVALESHRSNHGDRLPVGSRYEANLESAGTSWWLELLPHLGYQKDLSGSSWKRVASSGDFSQPTANPNIKVADGFAPVTMFCPISPLPPLNRPADHISPATRELLASKPAQGIAVPSYVAIAGSAPDMRKLAKVEHNVPAGRNTRDGKYGILSASGAFPPNRALGWAALTDGQQYTLLVGEQSGWGIDRQFEPPVLYDLRSSWPLGAFAGAEGPYQDLSPESEGINGSGNDRCFNITTVRYRPNSGRPQPGVVVLPATPTPDRPQGPPLPPVNQPPGPGHNHALTSPHDGGVNVLYADGNVRFLNDDIDLEVLLRLATRDDGPGN